MKVFAIVIATLLIIVAESANKKNILKTEEPLVHDYIKLAIWLLAGVIIGVYFEAKMTFSDFIKPIVEKGISGVVIAFGIYGLFMFATFVSSYL
jgi:heme/copper-type cytochrome/quinol oxidase subunit 2